MSRIKINILSNNRITKNKREWSPEAQRLWYGSIAMKRKEKEKQKQDALLQEKIQLEELAQFAYVIAAITKQEPRTFLTIFRGKHKEVTKQNLISYLVAFYDGILNEQELMKYVQKRVNELSNTKFETYYYSGNNDADKIKIINKLSSDNVMTFEIDKRCARYKKDRELIIVPAKEIEDIYFNGNDIWGIYNGAQVIIYRASIKDHGIVDVRNKCV